MNKQTILQVITLASFIGLFSSYLYLRSISFSALRLDTTPQLQTSPNGGATPNINAVALPNYTNPPHATYIFPLDDPDRVYGKDTISIGQYRQFMSSSKTGNFGRDVVVVYENGHKEFFKSRRRTKEPEQITQDTVQPGSNKDSVTPKIDEEDVPSPEFMPSSKSAPIFPPELLRLDSLSTAKKKKKNKKHE